MTRRACIFGGNWDNGDWAGSRQANVENWPDNSNEWIGARGRSDDQYLCFTARRPLRRRRLHTSGDCSPWWSARSPCFGEHLAGSGRTGRRGESARRYRLRDPRPGFSEISKPFIFHERRRLALARARAEEGAMAKRYRNLIAEICSDTNMREALRLTARGKRFTLGYLEFKEFEALNLGRLSFEMQTGAYAEGEPHRFRIFDPKQRLITALPFRDRVAQQALCRVIGPIFDRSLLPRTFACRPGKGTHAGVNQLQAEIRRLTREGEPLYFLKTDFSSYFASIERPVLWGLIDKKISCRATRRLLEAMVPREGIGLPIGSLTSQILANLYTGATLDRFLQQELRERHWYRYMDDIVVLGRSSEHLRAVKAAIEDYARRELGLRFSKWSIAPVGRGINFLGYRIWATHKLLRQDSVKRARRKIAAYRAQGDDERLQQFLGAWLGHAQHADTRNLVRALGVAR